MRLFEFNNVEVFDTTKTGKPKFDDILARPEKYPGVTTEIKYLSPKQAIALMAKGQNKTVKQIIDRRVAQGAVEKVKNIASDMSTGIKYDIPMVTISNGGFTQDGYHRLMAADSLGIKKVPILIIRR